MDWKELGKKIVGIGAPLLGTAIGGPAGGALGSILGAALGSSGDPEGIAAAIDAKGAGALSILTEFQTTYKIRLEELAVDRARIESQERIAAISQVNATMRAETTSKYWGQRNWRPYNGFLFGTAVVLIYFILPIAGADVPDVPPTMWILWASVLGITTIGRNAEKKAAAGDTNPGLLGQVLSAIKK